MYYQKLYIQGDNRQNGSMIVQQKNTHNHDANDRENERHVIGVRAKSLRGRLMMIFLKDLRK
jgi:hypothetical protein